jgi:hypothetical protein
LRLRVLRYNEAAVVLSSLFYSKEATTVVTAYFEKEISPESYFT